MAGPQQIWVFAYGSLMWRPGFDAPAPLTAVVTGWSRRLWQGSPDHRGTPQLPGRVATLVRNPNARCLGLAYAVQGPPAQAVLAAIDVREQGGYQRQQVMMTLGPARTQTPALTWVGMPDNRWFLGDAPLPQMVQTIRHARGDSGTNADYVVRLHQTLTGLGHADPHVDAVVEALAAR